MKVTVVIPVYNVEKYLGKCVESILSQTYRDLEIILIDDGSPDSSGVICDNYAKRDSRIQVIHKQNGGLSDARNAGIEIATGDYICFVDSDDWLEPETLQQAVMSIEDVDVVVWGYYVDYVDDDDLIITSNKRQIETLLSHKDGYKLLLQPKVLAQSGYAWNKLYRTGFLNKHGFRFEKGLSLIEDINFNFPLFMKSDCIKFINYLGSHYVQRNRTTLGTAYYDNRMELNLRVANMLRDLLCDFGAPIQIAQLEYECYLATSFRSAVRSIAQKSEPYSEKRKRMISLLDESIVNDILNSCRTKKLVDRINLFNAKNRWVDIMIAIEGRKR